MGLLAEELVRNITGRDRGVRIAYVSTNEHPTVLVVDFGSSYAQTLARRVRDAEVYSEVVPRNITTAELLGRKPAALIFAGDLSVLEPTAEEPGLFDLSALAAEFPVVLVGADDEVVTTITSGERREVPVEEFDRAALERVLFEDAEIEATWTAEAIAAQLIAEVREQVGQDRVILGLSGGVDSSVVAALINEAVGDQLTCVFVDHGLLRQGEREQVEEEFAAALGINLVTIDAEERFLEKLRGVAEPERKRKIIGEEFIRVFEDAQRDLEAAAHGSEHEYRFLAQGTIYPDVIESGVGEGVNNIKSHHNVGGLPDDVQFELVEPLRTLFKDEVRDLGRVLGVPESIVSRQPFPGPGLGVRVVGTLDKERLDTLRAADYIVREELTESGMDEHIWQCPVVLLADVRSVGVFDGERTYGHPIVLRPIMSTDGMTADWVRIPFDILSEISDRITAEVPGVNRVVLDITPKPPATIEWE